MTNSTDRDGIVSGTDCNDRIDACYVDRDGDRIDNPNNPDNNDIIYAGAGHDIVYGGKGDDMIDAGTGDDCVSGGDGNDTILLGAGNDYADGGCGDDDISGGTGNDWIEGGAGDDTLRGDEGCDTLVGGTGDDILIGGEGSDRLYGGDGDDRINGGDDNDCASGGDGDDLIRMGEGHDYAHGGDGNDTIWGEAGNDNLDGGDGNDTVYGGDGCDDLDGGAGHDVLVGGAGSDLLRGGSGDDLACGGEGDDVLSGGSGHDALYGGAGNDHLYGGSGDDNFYVTTGNDSVVGGYGSSSYCGTDQNGFDTLYVQGPITICVDGRTYNLDVGEDFTAHDARGYIRTEDGSHIDFREIDRIASVHEIDDPDACDPVPPPPICFTPGALIATPEGEKRVEDLRVGDKVVTRDNGLQEIRWVGHRRMGTRDLMARPDLKPIMIKAGSLGPNLPERDMMVSPSHRMLIANERTTLYFAENEVLVAAKHLVNGRGIHRVDVASTTYIHMLFDQHEVLLSNGAWTESFQPGDYSMGGLGKAQRDEIYALFPSLKSSTGTAAYTAARPTLKRNEAEILRY